MADQSYLIVGAGIFGISTAYYLKQKYPNASITVVDRDAYDADSRVAASWDWNKVVRADYDDFIYCRIGLEAQDIFETDPLWQPYFHKTGLYWMCGRAYSKKVIDNFKKLGRGDALEAIPIEEARKMYGGLFEESDYVGVDEVLINKISGWAAAGDCLRAVTKKIIELGVHYVVADIVGLTFDGQRRCTGIQTRSGRKIEADKVILCTGAFTPTLLDWSAVTSGIQDLRAGDRILAGGITTGMTQLDDETYKQYADMPVGIQGYTAKEGPFVGSLPPTKDRELKWWGNIIFKNTREVSEGSHISAPPAQPDYAQWDVSRKMQEDIRYVSSVFYGKRAANWKMSKHRVCWDAFTTSSDFIISPHPAAQGLFLATCGSFHGFKFFPIIGKYVVDMLDNVLEDELVGRWAWDRHRPDPKLNPDWPNTEMRELLDPVRSSRL